MTEVQVNRPLSGVEMREAILFDIRRALEQDDRFQGHYAYSGFSFNVKISISIPTAVLQSQEISREVVGSGGTITEPLETSEISTERPIQTPNDVRFETEQPLVFDVTDEKGFTTEKRVSYVGKDRSGRPKAHKITETGPPVVEKAKRNMVKGL